MTRVTLKKPLERTVAHKTDPMAPSPRAETWLVAPLESCKAHVVKGCQAANEAFVKSRLGVFTYSDVVVKEYDGALVAHVGWGE